MKNRESERPALFGMPSLLLQFPIPHSRFPTPHTRRLKYSHATHASNIAGNRFASSGGMP